MEVSSINVLIGKTDIGRKHLHKDLQPYVCLFENCEYGFMTLMDRELWTEHLGSVHGLDRNWESLSCPMCHEMTGEGRSVISLHIAKHMEEIAIDAMPRGSDSDVDSENESDATNHGYESDAETVYTSSTLPTAKATTPASHSASAFDTSGQIAPPGIKAHVTAALWEDEGVLIFQVQCRGVIVARREDNHMINGTKLLNVAGMIRGRRDGILKSEKMRHVVKIGPKQFKGVWIPFERALDFANKEKITELLYPLFVHNIGAFLYRPNNAGHPYLNRSAGASAMSTTDTAEEEAEPKRKEEESGK